MRRVLVTLIPSVAVACFDWNVAAPDGGTDATIDSPIDVAGDRIADSPQDVPVPPDVAVSVCPGLAANVAATLATAQSCSNAGGTCSIAGFPDECGCKVGVGDPTSPATKSYSDALGQFADAGCACAHTCPEGGSWICNNGDAGLACSYQ